MPKYVSRQCQSIYISSDCTTLKVGKYNRNGLKTEWPFRVCREYSQQNGFLSSIETICLHCGAIKTAFFSTIYVCIMWCVSSKTNKNAKHTLEISHNRQLKTLSTATAFFFVRMDGQIRFERYGIAYEIELLQANYIATESFYIQCLDVKM